MFYGTGGEPSAAAPRPLGGGGPFGLNPLASLFGGIDGMSYEDLLALQDRLGGVPRGATQDQIDALPTRVYQRAERGGGGTAGGASSSAAGGGAAAGGREQAPQSEQDQCAICLGEFEEGESVRTLPCFHTCAPRRFFRALIY